MGVSGLGSPDEWMGVPTRHSMATDSLVNVAALHESPVAREEKVGVAMLCGCAGADAASLVSKRNEITCNGKYYTALLEMHILFTRQ